jgi:hypothetical protein
LRTETPPLPAPAAPAEIAAREAEAGRRADRFLAVFLALVAGAMYAGLALRLAQGQFHAYFNLAFDFDPTRYVHLLGSDVYEPGGVKHPLVLMLRPLGWPARALGASPGEAAALVTALVGAATVAVVFLFLRRIGAARPEATALAALFAVSASQMITAMVPEAYGPAGFGIALVWLVAAVRLEDPARGRIARYVAAVIGFGITTTNVMQSVLAEALVWVRHRGVLGAVRPMLRFGVVLGAVLAVLVVAVWHEALLAAAADPVEAAKQVYWQRTKGEKVGLGEVVLRLAGYVVVAPDFTFVDIPGGIAMWDFRAPLFAGLSGPAAVLWHGFWVAGAVAFLANRRTRWLGAGLAAALLANIVLHIDFQFRGSLFLYAGHVNFLVFALGCGLAPLVPRQGAARVAYLGTVMALVVLVGGVSLDRAAELAVGFDTVKVDCLAPCD